MESLRQVTFAALGVSLLLCLISLGAPNWFKNGNVAHAGLWKGCTKTSAGTFCISAVKHTEWLDAVRAMMVLSMLSAAAATFIAILQSVKETFRSKTFLTAMTGAALASAVFGLIAISVFGAKLSDYDNNVNFSFDWAYWLAVAHTALIAVGTGLALSLLPKGAYMSEKE